MSKYQRAHPITIFFNLGRVLYLIIIPLLRGFIAALQGGFAKWLSSAWVDILIFALMLALAIAAWRVVGFRFDDKNIEVRSGFFILRRAQIPWTSVTTLSLVQSFYLRPFGAVRLRADTVGGSFKDPDFSILLSKRKAQALIDNRKPIVGQALGKTFEPATSSIIALSLLTSNSLGGILFIATLVSQSGKLLGREFQETLIGTFEQASRNVAFGIPPAAAAIGYALLAGWFIGFLLTFFRYKSFTLTRQKDTLSINGGLFTNRDYYIRYSDINFIDIRQSLTTKLFKLYTLYISAVGYGKQKDDISCIIPTEKASRFTEHCRAVFPTLTPAPRRYSPVKKGFMRFLGQPLTACTAVLLAIAGFGWAFPDWLPFILFVGLMLLVPAIIFLCIRIFDYKTGGLAIQNGVYTVRYSTIFNLHTVVFPAENIVKVELRQAFMQQFSQNCDLIIHTKAENHAKHCCRNLKKADMEQVFIKLPI